MLFFFNLLANFLLGIIDDKIDLSATKKFFIINTNFNSVYFFIS